MTMKRDEQHPGFPWATVLWGVVFFAGMIGTGLLIRFTQLVPAPWSMALMLLPMLALVPMSRAYARQSDSTACASPAARRYNTRLITLSFAYVFGLMVAMYFYREKEVTDGLAAALLALLPAIPTLGMIWAMARYVLEEQDEYLRARMVRAAMMATGLLLSIATFWGFMELFGVLPHVEAWWAFPTWAIALGLSQFWNKVREQ